MKRFFVIFLVIVLCISAVSCSKAGEGKIEETGETEAATDLVTPVAGKWTCNLKLSHVMTEAQHTKWSDEMAGELTVTLVFENDGNVKIFVNTADATDHLRKYFIASKYSEAAAEAAAKFNAKSLELGDDLKNLTYSFSENKVELSSKAVLTLSEDGKTLTPVLETCNVHHRDAENCKNQWFEELIKEMKFARA